MDSGVSCSVVCIGEVAYALTAVKTSENGILSSKEAISLLTGSSKTGGLGERSTLENPAMVKAHQRVSSLKTW